MGKAVRLRRIRAEALGKKPVARRLRKLERDRRRRVGVARPSGPPVVPTLARSPRKERRRGGGRSRAALPGGEP